MRWILINVKCDDLVRKDLDCDLHATSRAQYQRFWILWSDVVDRVAGFGIERGGLASPNPGEDLIFVVNDSVLLGDPRSTVSFLKTRDRASCQDRKSVV